MTEDEIIGDDLFHDDPEKIRLAREEKTPKAILFDGREMWFQEKAIHLSGRCFIEATELHCVVTFVPDLFNAELKLSGRWDLINVSEDHLASSYGGWTLSDEPFYPEFGWNMQSPMFLADQWGFDMGGHIIQHLGENPSLALTRRAVSVIREYYNDTNVADLLIEMSGHDDPWVRAQAVKGMVRGGREQEFFDILAARLKDPEDSVKKAAMTAIIRLDQNGLDELIDEAIQANPHLMEDHPFKSAKNHLERNRQIKARRAKRRKERKDTAND